MITWKTAVQEERGPRKIVKKSSATTEGGTSEGSNNGMKSKLSRVKTRLANPYESHTRRHLRLHSEITPVGVDSREAVTHRLDVSKDTATQLGSLSQQCKHKISTQWFLIFPAAIKFLSSSGEALQKQHQASSHGSSICTPGLSHFANKFRLLNMPTMANESGGNDVGDVNQIFAPWLVLQSGKTEHLNKLCESESVATDFQL